MLRLFCQLTNSTIYEDLYVFYSSSYITTTVQSHQLFNAQTEANINLFIKTTTNTFLRSLQMIRNTTHGDQLLSSPLTGFGLIGLNDGSGVMRFDGLDYGDCSCHNTPLCKKQSSIYNGNGSEILFNITGWYVGYYVTESLRPSTLESFYNQTSFNQLLYHLNSEINITILNSTIDSQYQPNAAIGDILNQLMVEKWDYSFSFESYYQQCQPKQCQYTYVGKFSAIYIVTTSMSIFGGLVKVGKIIVPLLIKLLRNHIIPKFMKKRIMSIQNT
ncbi:unnamed protein product [Didymodactylos carnosus]|uniref:Uncharacterized protein n=1 Tax=Didymodactylos carnosus TaxID=1234261 RepID=A0A815PCY1_9BILA|nr:unnamed protein product [Didymodactylos carnosus]CAF4321881.1 unnamed protein product [Didymodactylos carnosus]